MKNKEVQAQLRISSIELLKFFQHETKSFDNNNKAVLEYETSFGVQLYAETEEIGVKSIVIVKVQGESENVAELKVLIKFSIVPFFEIIKTGEENYEIPDILLHNLFNVASGTIRGILFEKLRGTYSKDQIFPLIDVRNLTTSNSRSV